MNVADGVPRLASRAADLKQAMRSKRIEHRQYILQHGQVLPEVRQRQWMN